MASIGTVIRQALEGSAPLTAVLTGGIFDASELGRQGLLPSTTGLYSGQVLNPCAIIRWGDTNTFGPHYAPQSERAFFEVYVYEDDGYASIDTAIRLIKQTLHRTAYTADNQRLNWVNWIHNSSELDAPELGGAAMKFARFELIFTEEL